MTSSIKALIVILGLGAFGSAHAFSANPISKAQQKQVRTQIKATLPAGAKIRSVKFGFGSTPPNFIGSGFEQATVKVSEGGKLSTMTFEVSPGGNLIK